MLALYQIDPQEVEVLYQDGDVLKSLGWANEYEFNEFRLRVARESATGYSIKFNDKYYCINEYGVLPDWPNGLFDFNNEMVAELIRIRVEKKGLRSSEKTVQWSYVSKDF